MSQHPGHPRTLLATVVASLALIVPLLAALAVSTPANAAGSVKLTVAGKAVAGQKTKLTATVKPKAKGRTVVFSVKNGKKWKKLGKAKTNKLGKAVLSTKKLKAGKQTVRAVAKKHKGQKAKTATTSVRVVAPRPSNKTDGKASTLIAPERVIAGSTFEVSVEIGAKVAVRNGVLTLTAPATGSQVTPPNDVTLASRKGTVLVGDVPAGAPQIIRLRWKAPSKNGFLEVAASLAGTGFSDQLHASIEVVPAPVGDAPMDGSNLHKLRAVQDLPADPDDLISTCYRANSEPVPSFAQAVQAANAYVKSQKLSGATDWTKLPGANTAQGLLSMFGAAHFDNRPGAMMAAALRGHQLFPNDSRHLTNAGMAANSLNHPGWAVAFLNKAADLPIVAGSGMPQEAVRLNNLGNAHATLGNFPRAASLLRQALAVDPENPILHDQLADYLACTGRKAEALDHLRTAYREDDKPDEVQRRNGDETYANADRVLDMTGAKSGNLTLLEIPVTMGKLAGLGGRNGYVKVEEDRLSQEFLRLTMRESQLRQQLNAQQANQHPAEVRRTNDLLRRVGGPDTVVSKEAQDAYQRQSAAASAVRDACFDVGFPHARCNIDMIPQDSTCGQHQLLFALWQERASARRTAILDYYAIVWPAWTGVQGHLKDPVAHELAGVRMEQSLSILASALTTDLRWASEDFNSFNHYAKGLARDATCDNMTPPTAAEPTKNSHTGAQAAECTEDAKKWGLQVEVNWFALKATCEAVSLEVSTAPPLIKGFAKVEGAWTGKSTMTIGVKLDARGYTFESAFYMEGNAQGQVTDFGWVVGQEIETPGPVKFKALDDKVKFSFMNIY